MAFDFYKSARDEYKLAASSVLFNAVLRGLGTSNPSQSLEVLR